MVKNALAGLLVSMVSVACAAASVTTSAPGWTFLETQSPTFALSNAEGRVAWRLSDWRGQKVRTGLWPDSGTLAFPPRPPGYYRVEYRRVDGGEKRDFTFCVVTTNRCRAANSFFAADSALSGCSRRGSYDCPWYGGDCWRVTAELLGKCGIVHTRERLEWGPFISPRRDVRDFSRYLASARAMKAEDVVSTGVFHDAPMWLKRPNSAYPNDLAELYGFMAEAARTFDPYYDSWEFWNEQELRPEPVWEYVAALKAFALGARAGSEKVIILPGSISSIEHFGYAQAMFDSDIAKYVQALNLHTYVPMAGYDRFHADIRKFLEEVGVPDWQVWLTESGTNLEGNGLVESSREGLRAHSPEQEMVMAEFFPKSAILHQQGGIFRNWFFLFGCYNEQSGARDWGTMRRDGTVKPIHAAMSAVTSELGDARLLGEKKIGDGLRGFVYEKPDGSRTLAFWSVSNLETSGDPPIRIRSDCARAFTLAATAGRYRVTDMMGTPSAVVAEDDGGLRLTATRFPQYLSGLHGVDADVPPADAGRLARYVAAPDEDLTVVVRPLLDRRDFVITGGSANAELGEEKGRITVEVWNLSPDEKRGRVEVSAGRLEGAEGELTLAPWSRTVVEAFYVPPAGGDLSFNVDFAGSFGGRRVSRVRVPMFNAHRFLGNCEVVPLPALERPEAWTRNDSGNSYSCVYDEEEKAVRFDVTWSKSSGVWFFPVHALAPGESFDGARYLEFEVKNLQDKVENDMFCVEVMCLYGDRPRKSAKFKSPGSHWELRRVMLPDDAGKMTAFRIGGLIHGHRLSYWIRNFRILKPKAVGEKVPLAAQPKSCVGMKRSWDPYPGWWEKRHEEKLAQIAASGGEIDLVFVGDSITHNWEGAHGPASAYGGKPLAELKKKYTVLNLGFGGDSTRNVLWRLQNGELDGYKAKCFMLMIGTNNGGCSAEDTAAGVKSILDLIARKQPQAVTILLPIFPSGATADHPWRASKEKVNALIRKFADGKKVVWHDFNSRFLNPDGTFPKGMMMKDDLHPLAPGYDIWAEEVAPLFRKVCGK